MRECRRTGAAAAADAVPLLLPRRVPRRVPLLLLLPAEDGICGQEERTRTSVFLLSHGGQETQRERPRAMRTRAQWMSRARGAAGGACVREARTAR